MLERYGQTFVDLATGKRSDTDALVEFYGAPLRFICPTFHVVMKDDAAIIGPTGVGGEIDRLRQTNFAESTLDRYDVNVLNDRAALVDALWLRRDNQGALMACLASDLPGGSDRRRVADHIGGRHTGNNFDRHAN